MPPRSSDLLLNRVKLIYMLCSHVQVLHLHGAWRLYSIQEYREIL